MKENYEMGTTGNVRSYTQFAADMMPSTKGAADMMCVFSCC